MTPLSAVELNELDRFLASDATSNETMMIDALDGYLTALVLGPGDVPVTAWLPGIWGPRHDHAPGFANPEQAQRIADLIVRRRDGILWALDFDPDDIDPIFDTASYQDKSREYLDGEMWAYGFIRGLTLARAAWQPVFDDAAAMEALLPIYILGADDVPAEQKTLSNTPAKREALTEQIVASIGVLWRFWHPDHQPRCELMAIPVQHADAKVGRNDPCPCGSGKKWKKCCGAH
jgi:uncharacterized protein